MSAALLCTLLGMGLARGNLSWLPADAPWLLLAVFFGLYTAHLMDTFVDVVHRGDRTPTDFPLLFRDSTGLIADRHYPPLIGVSAALTIASAAVPSAHAGILVAFPLMAGLAIALTYAPLLDKSTLGVTLGYPTGVVCASAAGYGLAAGSLDLRFGALATALIWMLAGTKIRSDIIDRNEDEKIDKRTVPVLIGEGPALQLGYALALGGILFAASFPLFLPLTPAFTLPALGVAAAVGLSARMRPFTGSMAMAGSLFALIAAELVVLALAG